MVGANLFLPCRMVHCLMLQISSAHSLLLQFSSFHFRLSATICLSNLKMEARWHRCKMWSAAGQCTNEQEVNCGCQDSIKLRSLGWDARGTRRYCPPCYRTWATEQTIEAAKIAARDNMCEVCLAELGITYNSGGSVGSGSSPSLAPGVDQGAALIAISGQLDHLTQTVQALTESNQTLVQRVTNLERAAQHAPPGLQRTEDY